ncbi:MFS transporter [Catenulispora yoronensis]|uniref:MFS transporter n=1 Tax=Catenulispora yoronensis TaxID=450799 RepID=UPI003CD05A55
MLLAGVVSVTGDWVLLTGLAYCVYVLTGSTVASALTATAGLLPQVFLGPVAGVFADRWDRKRTMIGADLLLAAGLLPLLAVGGRGQVWIVVGVLLWQGAVVQFFAPAEQAMVPRLVDGAELATANALVVQSRDVARLCGAAAGGVLAAAGGVPALAVADAASFLLAAVLLRCVRTSGEVERRSRQSGRVVEVFGELGAGLRLVAGVRVLRTLMLFVVLAGTGEGVMGTLFAPFVRDVLHGGGRTYGLISAVQAVGGIVGGLAVAVFGRHIPAPRLLGVGAVLFGAVDLVIFLYPLGYLATWPAVVGMVVVGVPGALVMTGLFTLMQQYTVDEFRGRAFGALTGLFGACQLIATLSAGFLARVFGIIPVLMFQGLCYVAAGFMVLLMLRGAKVGTEINAGAGAGTNVGVAGAPIM